jgi:hypothetical protein
MIFIRMMNLNNKKEMRENRRLSSINALLGGKCVRENRRLSS